MRAAWLWAGGRPAALTRPAAAYWHGMLERAPGVVDITVPRQVHKNAPRGVVLRRRDLAADDLVEIRNLWLADAPFAALETAVALPDGSAFLDRALQKHVSFPRFTARTRATSAVRARRRLTGSSRRPRIAPTRPRNGY